MPVTINGNGTITGVSVGGLPDGIVDTDMLAANAVSSAKLASGAGGKLLQVVHVNSNTHQTSTSTSFVDLSGISASITPSSSSNKILIMCNLAISKANDESFLGRVVRDGSAISGAGGVRMSGATSQEEGIWLNVRTTIYDISPFTVIYLDSPSTTSAITYKAQGKTSGSANGFSFNRTGSGSNQLYNSPSFSSITLMEVAA